MTSDTIFEVIEKLVGRVRPVGDSAIDAERFENMGKFIEIFDKMHTVLDGVAYDFRESKYASEKKIAAIVDEYFKKTFSE